MPYGILAYRTIGYVNKEANAETGIESAYNSYLEGVTGRMWLQKISGGDWIPLNEKDRIDPKNGSDVVTTIDIELQDVAESALKRHLQDHNAESGCVIVMEVATGAIRAIANLGQQKDGLTRKTTTMPLEPQ
jgi:cell division protein FtsI (penicillin-binding protein 3)